MTTHIGIDPGTSGAIAIIDFDQVSNTSRLVALHDMPVIEYITTTGKNRKRVNGAAVHEILKLYLPIASICLEAVGPMPRDGCIQAFSLGYASASVETAARIACLSTSTVRPQVWKVAFGLTSDKSKSRILAQRLAPLHADQFARVKDADRAEAYLIALYGAYQGSVSHLAAPMTRAEAVALVEALEARSVGGRP